MCLTVDFRRIFNPVFDIMLATFFLVQFRDSDIVRHVCQTEEGRKGHECKVCRKVESGREVRKKIVQGMGEIFVSGIISTLCTLKNIIKKPCRDLCISSLDFWLFAKIFAIFVRHVRKH
jgi:hypothetical protein